MLFSILAALGFFAVVLSLLAWRSNLHHSDFVVDQHRMAFLTKLAWAAGVVAASLSHFASYSYVTDEGTWRIVGFPFVAATLDPQGEDFMQPLAAAARGANFLIWLVFPQLLLWAYIRFARAET